MGVAHFLNLLPLRPFGGVGVDWVLVFADVVLLLASSDIMWWSRDLGTLVEWDLIVIVNIVAGTLEYKTFKNFEESFKS